MFDIRKAISGQDAHAMSKYFYKTVDVSVPDTDNSFAAAQAEFVLKEFFTRYPKRDFRMTHEDQSGSTFYMEGDYWSGRDRFAWSVYFRKRDEKYAIREIRFDPE